MSAPSSNLKGIPNILLVAADDSARATLRQELLAAGCVVSVADDAAVALRSLHHDHCNVVILDLHLAGIDSLALVRLFRAQPRNTKLLLIGRSDDDVESRKADAYAAGVDEFVRKSSPARELVSLVKTHLAAVEREGKLIGTNRELRFFADLGRDLLRALDGEALVRRVAGATFEGTGAAFSAACLKSESSSYTVCVFDREGSAEGLSLLQLGRLDSWLDTLNGSSSARLESPKEFLIKDEKHVIEYVAPLRFAGRTNGLLIVGFDKREDCGETECRLVDAAAQQAALAAQISFMYQAARQDSVNLAREVGRRTAEAEAQRRFTEAIIDSLPLSLYAVDRDYRIVAWNRNRELGELGMPRGSVLGRNIFDVLTRQKREVLEKEFASVFTSGEIERIEQETVLANGEVKYWLISKIPMWIDVSGQVSHVITVGEEITDRVEANRAVARADKLAAIGRLAAGVVHEINNPLATISACAESLEARLSEGEFGNPETLGDLREYLGLIRSEAFRCKTITNGLLDFSRVRAAEPQRLDLREVISSAARLLSHQGRGGRVEFEVEVAKDLDEVLGDAGQIQQALIALATNALDAMPDGGRLRIAAHNKEGAVLVEITDSGVGIPAENLTRIFEPFFTTKEVGSGTGLGLAVCYGILTEHGGSLDVQSTVGVGTTFTISLPAANQNGELAV